MLGPDGTPCVNGISLVVGFPVCKCRENVNVKKVLL